MTFLPDVDIKSVVPPENLIGKSHFPNWATEHILYLTNTAVKWGIEHKDALQKG